jgi:hypothetical protein
MRVGGARQWAVVVGLLALAGCGRRGEQPAACVPGAVVVCPCAGAPVGSQTCQSGGTFGACVCPAAAVPAQAPPPEPEAARPLTPSRADITTAMQAVSPAARACGTGSGGSATVTVMFSSEGSALVVTVAPPFGNTPVGECIVRAVNEAHVPPFSQRAFSTTYPVALR